MAHIHDEPGQYDHTVSFFIIRTDLGEPQVLLHLHKRIGKLMMFGGHVELNEDPWSATIREIIEETGYETDQLRVLQPSRPALRLTGAIVHPFPVVQSTGRYPGELVHFHSDTAYALVAVSEPRLPPMTGESTDFRLVTKSQLEQLSDDEIVPMWREVGIAILDWHLIEWQPVELNYFEYIRP